MENEKKLNSIDLLIFIVYGILTILYAATFVVSIINPAIKETVRFVHMFHSVGGIVFMAVVFFNFFIKKTDFHISKSPYWIFAIMYTLFGTNLEQALLSKTVAMTVIYGVVTAAFAFITGYGFVSLLKKKEDVEKKQLTIWLILTVIAMVAFIIGFFLK